MANKLSGKSLHTIQDDTRRCYKGPNWARVYTGTGGEWRELKGTVKAVFLAQQKQTGNVTVAVFRVVVAGKSRQKGYKCILEEYNQRDQDFSGDAYIKLKHSNGQIAMMQIEVRNDHWGMMKEAMVSLANNLGFIVMAR